MHLVAIFRFSLQAMPGRNDTAQLHLSILDPAVSCPSSFRLCLHAATRPSHKTQFKACDHHSTALQWLDQVCTSLLHNAKLPAKAGQQGRMCLGDARAAVQHSISSLCPLYGCTCMERYCEAMRA